MANSQIHESIKALQEFFNVISVKSPEAIKALELLNNALANIGSGKFTVTADTFATAFDTVIKNANQITTGFDASSQSTQKLAKALENLLSVSNRFATSVRSPGAGTEAYANLRGGLPTSLRTSEDQDRILSSFRGSIGRTTSVQQVNDELSRMNALLQGAGRKEPLFPPETIPEIKQIYDYLAAIQRMNIAYAQHGTNVESPWEYENRRAGGGGMEESFDTTEDYIRQQWGEEGLKNVEKFAEKYGYSVDKITKINREASTGMARVQFTKKHTMGGDGAHVFDTMNMSLDKHGTVLKDTQKRFRTFSDAIVRDIGEVAKWTLAIGVVYAPIRKFEELIDEMIVTETKLAEVQIVTAQSSSELYKTFDGLVDVASEMGESVAGTVDSYRMAYIAAGNLKNELERSATATILLKDSLALSQLSGMDEAQALDVLSAALKQLDMELTEGVSLLDKWVAVSKVANVDIESLAMSFSIVATAANNVGLEVDELNAVIAASAEVSNKSATETGNMVRAFISGFQTDTSVAELTKYGIAVKDVDGNVRAFMDVMYDIRAMSDAGLISEQEMAKLAEVMGGGARRGAQFNAFMENLGRITDISTVSANAAGDTYSALTNKLDTTSVASERLANSFTELAMSLGNEGNLLDTATKLLNVLTGITKFSASTTKVLGSLTPYLAMAGAGSLWLGRENMAGKRASIVDWGANMAYRTGYGAGKIFNRGAVGSTTPSQYYHKDTAKLSGLLYNTNTGLIKNAEAAGDVIGNKFATAVKNNPAAFAAGGMVFASAAMSLINGDAGSAAAQTVGAALGGVAGSAFGAPALGIVLGSTAGQALYSTAVEEYDIGGTIAKAMAEGQRASEKDVSEETDRERKIREAGERLDTAQENLMGYSANQFELAIGQKGDKLPLWLANIASSVNYGTYQLFGKKNLQGMDKEQYRTAVASSTAPEDILNEYREAYKNFYVVNQGMGVDIQTETTNRATAIEQTYSNLFSTLRAEREKELGTELSFGDMNITTYKEQMEYLQTMDTQLSRLYAVIGDELKERMGVTGSEAIEALFEAMVKSTGDEQEYLIALFGQIAYNIENNLPTADLEKYTAKMVQQKIEGQQFQAFEAPSIYSQDVMNEDAVNEAIRTATIMRESYISAFDLPESVKDKWREDLSEFAVLTVDEFGKNKWKIVDNLGEFFSPAMEEAMEKLDPSKINMQAMTDISQEQLMNQILPRARQFEQQWANEWYGGEVGGERGLTQDAMRLILSDGLKTIEVNQLAFKLAQEETNELLQKQLDGVYNLPEGAYMWVPADAAELAAKTLAGGKETTTTSPTRGSYTEIAKATALEKSADIDYLKELEEDTLKRTAIKSSRTQPGFVEDRDLHTTLRDNYFQRQRGLLPDTTTTTSKPSDMNLLERVLMYGMLGSIPFFGGALTASAMGANALDKGPSLNIDTKPVRLEINMTNTSQLVLDGRTVANTIKRYLFEDLLRFGSGNTTTKTNIVN